MSSTIQAIRHRAALGVPTPALKGRAPGASPMRLPQRQHAGATLRARQRAGEGHAHRHR